MADETTSTGDGTFSYILKEQLINIDHVSVTYGNTPILNDCVQRVDNIVRTDNSGILQGQVVAILGPSGIGKTTLFRVMAGLEEPTSGRVLITENQIPVERGTVGVVAQSYPLFEYMTVRKNLFLAARHAGLSRKDAQDHVSQMLDTFDLRKQEDHYPTQLSGGQRQRVAIARQILNSNWILLMAEPFSGQDIIRLWKTCSVIQKVAQHDERFTIVLVTHDIGAALTAADTVWLEVNQPKAMMAKRTQEHPLEYYLDLKYPVMLHADPDGGFVAEVPDLPGCITQAETADEAWKLIEDARKAWLEVAYRENDKIPLPATAETHSGRV